MKKKYSQIGRSMIEMLGVLAIVGVISVGGFNIISKAMLSHQYTQAMSDAAQLADDGRRLVCQYHEDSGYHNIAYGVFLYKSGKYPSSLNFNKENSVYEGVLDINYKVITIDETGAFKIIVSNVPQELCIRLAIHDWGTVRSSGLSAIKAGNTSAASFTPDTAATACSASSNTVELSFKGCQ